MTGRSNKKEMDKNLILPMYVGAKIWTPEGTYRVTGLPSGLTVGIGTGNCSIKISSIGETCFLMLRRFCSMTGGEIYELGKLLNAGRVKTVNRVEFFDSSGNVLELVYENRLPGNPDVQIQLYEDGIIGVIDADVPFSIVPWLCDKKFDCFGWIGRVARELKDV